MPKHTDVSLAASYESFLKYCAMPLLETAFNMISAFTETPIEVKYDRVERAGDGEQAKITKNMSQAGIFTINELRERWGLGPIDGGDEIPQPAGSGEQGTGGNENAGNNAD